MDEARRESEAIIKKAEEAALRVKESVLKEAHSVSEKLLVDTGKKIQAEREKIFREAKSEIADLVYAAVEKSIGDLAGENLKTKMVEDAMKFVASRK